MMKLASLLVFLCCTGLAVLSGCGNEAPAPATAPAETAADPDRTGAEPPAGNAAKSPAPSLSEKPRDPDSPTYTALMEVLEKPDLVARVAALVELLPTLGPEAIPDVRDALGAFEDKLAELGSAEYALLIDFWSSHDPEAAARYMLAESPYGFRLANAAQPIRAWARKDPVAASEAFLALLNRIGRVVEVAETGVIWGWFESGEPGLTGFIATLPDGPVRQRAISLYARLTLRRDGSEAAARWAESIPDDDRKYKLAVFRQTAIAMAIEDIDAARAWCDEHCGGPHGSSMRPLIARHYGEQAGAEAMAWLAEAPEGRERDLSVSRAFGGWWAKDSGGASAWMEAQREQGLAPYLYPAVGVYSVIMAREQGRAGVEWALAIPEEEPRVAALLNAARTWRAKDREAADAWLETSPLTEEQRENVRNPPRGPAFEAPPQVEGEGEGDQSG